MSKKRIHIDDLFRRGLGNMQLPVDNSDFAEMQRMLAAAQKRRRRRRAVIWLVAGMLLLSGGITGGYMYYGNQNTADQGLAEQKAPVNDKYSGQKDNLNRQPEQLVQPGAGTSPEGNLQGENNTAGNGETTQPQTQGVPAKNTPVNPGLRKEKTQPVKKETHQPEQVTGEKPVTGNTENEPAEEVVTGQESKEISNVLTPDSITETVAEAAPEAPKDSAKEETTKKEGKEKSKHPSVASPFSIGINAGPLLNTFGISNNTNYGRIRNQGDEAKDGLNAAFTLNYQLSRWMFSAGLGVNSIRGGGSYQYHRQVWDSIPVLGPGGEIKGYLHTNYRDSSFNFTLEQRFSYITVPIFASYNLPLGGKWGLNAGAGVQVQYLAGLKGRYINPSNLFTFDLKNDGFIRKWNFAGSINLGVYYNLNRYFTINTSLTYTHFANSMLGKTTGVGIRPRNVGLQIGLRYNLLKAAE